jgi:hypothetical protein
MSNLAEQRTLPQAATRRSRRSRRFSIIWIVPLAPIYGWFTEGFDTPDLRAAKRCSRRPMRS